VTIHAARFAIAAIAAAWAVTAFGATAHADEGWVITSFQSDINIAADSTLTVREDIRVDFGNLQKHGIFRTIPLRYRYDDSHDRYYDLSVMSVTDGSRPVEFAITSVDDNEVIKIGNPSVLVTGKQRYVITYAVAGAMNSFSDHDELFWNVDGALWPVPKLGVGATVHLPSAAFQKAACYQGPQGSRESCNHVDGSDLVSFASTRQLGSGEEMSAVVALSKGAVRAPPPMLEPRLRQFPQDAFDINPLTVVASALVLVAGIGFVIWNWWVHGRDRAYLTQYYLTGDPREHAEPLFSHQPVVVEFEPPQNLRPAELGLILDETADAKDVTATIVDLAVRGHLTIQELAGKPDWMLTWKGSPASDLTAYEKTIIDGLFTGRTQVALSSLRGTFAPTLNIAESQIYSDALARKLFSSNPRQARAAWGCLGIAVVLVGIAVAVGLGLAFGWGLIGAAIVVAGIALTISFPFMPQRTAAGRDLLQHTLGFRLYMTTAEKYRQQFAAKAEIFTQLLPYAIVFGCVTMWAKAFEGIDTSGSNNWYVGPGPFQAALLVSSLQSMNANISSAISFTPPSSGSSSGFGGGGFSGGGGGGGGGGSW
jgi:uncharacterized protein (TIGR04222 family)